MIDCEDKRQRSGQKHRSAHDANVTALRAAYDIEVVALHTAHDTGVATLRTAHDTEVATLRTAHDTEIAVLRAARAAEGAEWQAQTAADAATKDVLHGDVHRARAELSAAGTELGRLNALLLHLQTPTGIVKLALRAVLPPSVHRRLRSWAGWARGGPLAP